MIDVVMTVHNVERYIRDALRSVLTQTWGDFVVTVVDDASTDGTADILRRFDDPRLRVLRSEANLGPAGSAALAIEAGERPWIARMDGDDIAHPHRLERQMRAAHTNPEVIGWGASVRYINERGRPVGLRHAGPESVAEFSEWIRRGIPIMLMHPTFLVRREALAAVGGYDTSLTVSADLELWSRLVEIGPLLSTRDVLLDYRLHRRSVSQIAPREQQRIEAYVSDRYRRRARGLPAITLEQFTLTAEDFDRSFTYSRHYRDAWLAYANRDWLAAMWGLGRATLADPRHALARAVRQVTGTTRPRTIDQAQRQWPKRH